MKDDERALLRKLRELHGGPYRPSGNVDGADDVGATLGMHEKRVHYILRKWDAKSYWESGVSVRTGWFTPEGWEALKP